MLKKLLLMVIVCLVSTGFAFGQTGTLTGTVTDASTGESLPGVNIYILDIERGTATGPEGQFTIEDIEYGTYTVRATYVGYQTYKQQVTIDQADVKLNISIGQSTQQLEDVVVTALGIERKEKSLGYSVQKISGEDVSKVRETNFVSSLTGKVAGANISNSSTMGGSSRIVIRGAKSVAGNNQPLFVVDGVPINNSNFTSTAQQSGGGGYDYGNAAQIINPNNIASVSVLKGPSASALYGSRAANGVIQITTKDGSLTEGIGITVNSGVKVKKVYGLPDYQNEYGGGGQGPFKMNSQGQLVPDYATDTSWGPPLDGRMVREWFSYDDVDGKMGETTPWDAHPDNIKNFFNTGIENNNNISLYNGTDTYNYRISLTNVNNEGILPNSSMQRNEVSFNGSLKLTDKLTTSISTNYVYSKAEGRVGTGYNSGNTLNPMLQFNHFGQRQIDLSEGSPMRNLTRPDGTQRTWNWADPVAGTINYADNPFWLREKNYQDDDKQRIYGNFTASYDFNSNLNLETKLLTDFYTSRRGERVAVYSSATSRYSEGIREVQETNSRTTLTYTGSLNEDISLDAFVAGNIRYNQYNRNIGQTQGGLSAPGIYSLENSIDRPDIDDHNQESMVYSLISSASLGYKEMLYLDGTLRNDWSSTLPEDNNSYLYPSITGSLVFSELGIFEDQDILSYGKLRIGYAKVGSDTSPYRLKNTYPFSTPFGSSPQLSVSNTLNNSNLKPETTYSWEVGTELSFFNNRLGLDVTLYKDNTEDQILAVDVSPASGSNSQLINAGEIENKGVEVMLDGTPVQTKNFQWDVTVNWSKNKNKVVQFAGDISNYRLANAPFGLSINAREGEPYGAFVGTDYVYDGNGNKVIAPNGNYKQASDQSVLGSYVPDWTGGLSTSISYKGLSASITFNGQKGGDVYSVSNLWGKYSGMFAATAENDVRELGVVPQGVDANGNAWTKEVPAVDFFQSFYGLEAAFVYDASYIKIQEATVGYDLPRKWLSSLPIRSLRVSLVGRNLAMLFKNAPNIDPSIAISAGNVQGVEAGQIPPQRTLGFNISMDL
ncbi:SusC/RagA family TonB-linked outer membrane protein [Fodinibius halophilus]|uniref:SusC/RagA family TonB-linked outer membrane protein n=1 Tax=Fodinibius halophilus TaxID=1736908 RepID=A0A6M1T807_9BACT|nr:SusC/RagA family TonB-linked outer membrane protein [Fodinibius halophilus]NGP89565.1 SusC/RagA family TonB-linked outer membrane protein [Fodinibius halophilus]